MKIKVIHDGPSPTKRYWPYELSIRETERVVTLLENNSDFEGFVAAQRIKHNIPPDGFMVDTFKYVLCDYLNQDGWDTLFYDCIPYTRKLGLPEYWYSSIAHFVVLNVFFTPERFIFNYKYNERKESFEINITEKISKTELINLIKEHWNEMEEYMRMLPKRAKGSNLTRTKLAKEIALLRDSKKLTFKKIADKLYAKYCSWDDVDVINEDYVKVLYHRWKKQQISK